MVKNFEEVLQNGLMALIFRTNNEKELYISYVKDNDEVPFLFDPVLEFDEVCSRIDVSIIVKESITLDAEYRISNGMSSLFIYQILHEINPACFTFYQMSKRKCECFRLQKHHIFSPYQDMSEMSK